MEHPEADAQSHRRQAGAQGHVSGEEHRKAKNPQHQQGNPPVRHKGHPQATEDTLSSPEAQDHRIIMTHRDQDALGLGACWIHRAREEFESPEGKTLLAKWGITGDYIGVGHCILGYPASAPQAAAPRKENFVTKV